METPKEHLFHAFKSTYSTKYRFYQDDPIGGGAYGYVYKALDILRSIDVAVKIFIEGRAPHGAERAWNITSRIIDPQIAPTSTIEEFRCEETVYVAAVSHFIPGRSVKEIFDWADSKSASDRSLVAEDLAKTLVPSLLGILEKCHRLGYGHGDLHEGNVMTFFDRHRHSYYLPSRTNRLRQCFHKNRSPSRYGEGEATVRCPPLQKPARA